MGLDQRIIVIKTLDEALAGQKYDGKLDALAREIVRLARGEESEKRSSAKSSANASRVSH